MSEINYFFTDDFLEAESKLQSIGKKKIIKKNTIISDINAHPHYSYYIKRGICKLNVLDENGSEKIMCFFGKGSLYPIIIYDQYKVLENYLEFSSITEVEAYRFPSVMIKELVSGNPDFAYACIDYYVRLSGLLLGRSLLNLYNNSTKSVCSFLYLFYNKNPADPSDEIIGLSQDDIGKILGLSRVQVSRVLSMLRNDNIIVTNRNNIEILDFEGLKTYCSDVVE